MQVLQTGWDGTFSETSYGFRPKHSAHQAVERAQAYIASGYAVVVDIDLEKFFDRVNHDILMGRLAKRVADKRLLKLIRGFLTRGGDGGRAGQSDGRRARRKAARSRRCCRICCWTSWTRNWRSAATASCATPTTATSTCAVSGQASG